MQNYNTNYYLPLLLLFILSDIMCDNYIVGSFNKQSINVEFIYFTIFLIVKIVFAPLQAGFSDFYCRKKSILTALLASLASMGLVYAYNQTLLPIHLSLILMLFFKGGLGNIIPLSWAAIADTKKKNFRFSFALSTAPFAVGYLALIVINKYLSSNQADVSVISMYLMLIILCYLFFKDIRDIKNHEHLLETAMQAPSVKNNFLIKKFEDSTHLKKISYEIISFFYRLKEFEIPLLIKDWKNTQTRKALGAFWLWEISLYSILVSLVDFHIDQASIAIAMMSGYLIGIIILKSLKKASDTKMIKIGYLLSFFSLTPYFIFFKFIENSTPLISICYFFHTLGNAFLCPTLFSILSKERKIHEQGKIYGLVESTDTAAFLIASLAILCYNYLNLHLAYLISFSFISFSLSWLFYSRFKQIK